MAKITIFEKDVTTAGSGNVTQNVAYVPGYSIMGPLNTPTLCNTLDDFYRIFGNAPYVFKGLQTLGTETVAISGDYEKSFIYAAELLRSGMPVLFERVGSTSLDYASYSMPVYESIYRAFTAQKVNSIVNAEFTKVEEAGSHIYTYINDSFKHEVYGIKPETLVINIGDIEITADEAGTLTSANALFIAADSSFNREAGELKLAFSQEVGGSFIINYELIQETVWVVEGKYNKTDNELVWSLSYATADSEQLIATDNNDVIDYIILENGAPKYVSGLVTPTGLILTGSLNKEKAATVYANNVINVKAKYKGSYGENITVKLTPIPTHINMYTALVTLSGMGETKTKSTTVSLSKNSDKYIGNVDLEYVTFADTKLDENIINSTLYAIEEAEFKLNYTANNVDEFTIADMYAQLARADLYAHIEDRAQYNVKFITSGSYPVFKSDNSYMGIVTNMLKCAGNRGDAIALIDAFDEEPLTLHESISSLPTDTTADTGEDTRKYGAMIVPSAKYQMQTVSSILTMPGSFAYLRCAAASGKNSENWYAVSGVTRGLVPNIIELNKRMTGAIADKLQSRIGISINPITYISPYGYCIWGNRTLFNNDGDLKASSFLNIRMLTNDVKKIVYQAARRLTFELNSDVLWLNFRSQIEPTLERMVSGSGLSGFKVQRVATDKKATVACLIKLYAVEAIEDWDIHIELNDSYVSVV